MTTDTERDTYTFALRALADVIDVDNLPPPLDVSTGAVGLAVQVWWDAWDAWATLADGPVRERVTAQGDTVRDVDAVMNRGLPFRLSACLLAHEVAPPPAVVGEAS